MRYRICMVLFLDFDGVLHPMPRGEADVFASLHLLEAVLREFEAVQVVISSSWREVHPFDEIREYFSPDLQRRIIGVTPMRFSQSKVPLEAKGFSRHAECVTYMRRHRMPGEPWLVLDDQPDLFNPSCEQLLLVDGSTGMTAADADRLRDRLAEPASRPREIAEGATYRSPPIAWPPACILFLDLDGVTHPDPCDPADQLTQLPLIEDVLRAHPACAIVISSSWRITQSIDQIRANFSRDIRGRVVGATPERAGNRQAECMAWLRETLRTTDVPWIAIDDRASWFDVGCAHLLVTDQACGFTERDAVELDFMLRQRLAHK